jgi:hypothetical protein
MPGGWSCGKRPARLDPQEQGSRPALKGSDGYDLRRMSGADVGPDDDSQLLDVLIRAGLILALSVLCYQVISPFLTLLIWALILAVTL